MAHLVNRKGYWSLEESYREGGKVRKRVLRYYGKRFSDPDARLQQMLATAERKAEEWDAFQRETFGETAQERANRLRQEEAFDQARFLTETVTPQASDHNFSEEASLSPPEETSPASSSDTVNDHGISPDASPSQLE